MPSNMTPDEHATVRPGETLILRYADQISQDQAATIRERVAERLPGVSVVIIGACDQMLVYVPGKWVD